MLLYHRLARMLSRLSVGAGTWLARTGFDVVTQALPWDEQLVLRRTLLAWRRSWWDLGTRGFFVGLFAMAQAHAYHVFVVLDQNCSDSWSHVSLALGSVVGVYYQYVVFLTTKTYFFRKVVVIARFVRTLPRPMVWRSRMIQRWQNHRDAFIATLWRQEPLMMVELEQKALRRALSGKRGGPSSATPRTAARRRL